MANIHDADMDRWTPADVGRFLVNIGPGKPWSVLGMLALRTGITGAVLRARARDVDEVLELFRSLRGGVGAGGSGGSESVVLSRAVARSIHLHVVAFLHGVGGGVSSFGLADVVGHEADVDIDADAAPLQLTWAEGEEDVDEARELTPEYMPVADSSPRDMSDCPTFPLPPSLLSNETWNSTKQALFHTQPAHGLCAQVARRMNAIQHYYAEQTSLVLFHGRKVAEMVALGFVPAAMVASLKTSGRRVDLNTLADHLEDNRLLPVPILDALRTLQLKGNKHSPEKEMTPDHHRTKPEVVLAVHTVRTGIRARRRVVSRPPPPHLRFSRCRGQTDGRGAVRRDELSA